MCRADIEYSLYTNNIHPDALLLVLITYYNVHEDDILYIQKPESICVSNSGGVINKPLPYPFTGEKLTRSSDGHMGEGIFHPSPRSHLISCRKGEGKRGNSVTIFFLLPNPPEIKFDVYSDSLHFTLLHLGIFVIHKYFFRVHLHGR